ncbi:uncharacterized protein MYCFIDRAFT_205675 [Pseudocercospora fijiensis CIRAD86]|uniref:Uncharacterized protein n=1 Tax=Pseudocercospora fijiensis (strain CIRAD86) TaxID=383855 RepID=N1Q974_PSEFD|nr:uncharacterized protein MYCFIDRAFT_205675 [Pseudocercospora fijiensis CIRAD86]EME87447.1 hypothetical protein MYCFIDRAFT_205675 [Pseudocercospora fijiensis CIRAD86]
MANVFDCMYYCAELTRRTRTAFGSSAFGHLRPGGQRQVHLSELGHIEDDFNS